MKRAFLCAVAALFMGPILAGCGGGKSSNGNPSDNANLLSLVLSSGTLSPAFSAGTTSYTATVDYPASTVTVTPTAEDGKATIAVNSTAVQSGAASQAFSLTVGTPVQIEVVVTAEDGSAKQTYTVVVTRQACVPSCSGRDCGDDECGGTCGTCNSTEQCNSTGQCVVPGTGTWVAISAGTFTMGSPTSELGRGSDEVQHPVTLTGGFLMLSTEVTQGEFNSEMEYNPSFFSSCGDNCPVEMVNWHEAAAYCNALSAAAGRDSCYTCTNSGTTVSCTPSTSYTTPYNCPGYRLPTEAEWEYAARAGTTTATYNGDLDNLHLNCEAPNSVLDPIAWFCGNSSDTTHAVGTAGPNGGENGFGLNDMLGNVWEWCHDWYGNYSTDSVTDPYGPDRGYNRVLRSGSWFDGARGSRAAYRFSTSPDHRSNTLGLRPVRSLP